MIIQLKDELRRWKMKTTGGKADLIKRLRAIIIVKKQKDDLSDHDNGEKENQDSENETDSEQNARRKRERSERHLLMLKDVEDSIGTFDAENDKTVDRWTEYFEDIAELCSWNNIQEVIYVKKTATKIGKNIYGAQSAA